MFILLFIIYNLKNDSAKVHKNPKILGERII